MDGHIGERGRGMTIYELSSAFNILSDMLLSGEIDEDTYKDTVEALPVEESVEYFAKMRKNYTSDEAKIAEEIRRLTERKASLKAAQEHCNESIKQLIGMTGKKTVKTALFTVTVKKNAPGVNILDEDKIPLDYREYKFTPKRDEIRKALLAGEEIPGAELKTSESVSIR